MSEDHDTNRDELRVDTDRELRRVVDRLASMPLVRAEGAAPDVRDCAEALVVQGRLLGVPIPPDAALPDLQPQGFAALIAILGRDCLAAAGRDGDLTAVLAALVTLRRALP